MTIAIKENIRMTTTIGKDRRMPDSKHEPDRADNAKPKEENEKIVRTR
jgi:hypothetical protein